MPTYYQKMKVLYVQESRLTYQSDLEQQMVDIVEFDRLSAEECDNLRLKTSSPFPPWSISISIPGSVMCYVTQLVNNSYLLSRFQYVL